jgi:hypothetical protein
VRVVASGAITFQSWWIDNNYPTYYINSQTTNKLTLSAGTSIYIVGGQFAKFNLPNGSFELLAGTSITQGTDMVSFTAKNLIFGSSDGGASKPVVTFNGATNYINNLEASNISSLSLTNAQALTVNSSGLAVTGGVTLSSVGNLTINGAVSLASTSSLSCTATGSNICDVQVNAAISKPTGADTSLTLTAKNNVVVSSAVTSSSNKLNINLIADSDQNGAGVVIINNNLTSNGGNIAFGNGSTINFGGVTTQVGGDVYVTGSTGVTWATNGGNLSVYGQTLIGNTGGLSVSTSGGTVLFNGSIDSANQYLGVALTSDWTAAKTAATSGTGANTGDTYLATITSRLENAIASQAVS